MQVYKNNNPDVSIILAAYNRAKLLRNCIDSVISQSFKKWELIVVDDGSTDETFSFIKDYQTYPNIRYMRHSHRMLPLTRNSGIRSSIGKFLTFLDSDDIYLPDHLSLRVKFMEENPEVDLIHGGFQVIGSPYVVDKNDLTKKVHLNECFIGGTFFGKRHVFTELEGFKNIAYSEDSEFMERAILRYNIKKVDFQTYIYNRNSQDSICNTM